MLYALICHDKPGSAAIRKAHRNEHLEHIRASEGMVVQAGPFLDSKGNMCGSLLIFEAKNIDQVESWAEDDAYSQAGLFESVIIRPWKRVVG